MNEIFLDTETTGLSFQQGHKIVEIACIETKDLIATGKVFHKLINPKRSVPEEAFKIHGFSQEFLSNQKTFDQVVLVYNRFKNAATQIIEVESFLPIVAEKKSENNSNVDYIFEPSKSEIISELLPKSLKMQLFKALRDSFASEHGARMTAMHKATDNATELRDALTLQYNKARQAAITNEILEIVGGAEALAG